MNVPAGPRLNQPRDITALFRDALGVWWSNFGAFLVLAAAVIVPVELIVGGWGLEQLTAPYDPTLEPAEFAIPLFVNALVLNPLITAICISALHAVANGERAQPRRALVEGFEAFTPIFFAVLLAAAGTAVGLVLIVPGIYLFIRWYFVPQTVVIEGARGPRALSHSTALTRGHWWRTLGIVVITNLAVFVPGLVITAPFAALAESADREVWALAGQMLTNTLTAPFVALISTLLYYDLRARGPKV